MKNHDHSPLTKPEPKHKAVVFESPFGKIAFLPEHKAQPVFMCLPGEEPRRVRGNEKRLLLSLLAVVEAARHRPLPRENRN